MEQFSYAFITTMIHSIWQSALLLMLYALITTANTKSTPLVKRNLLFTLLGLQLISSAISFYIIFSLPLNEILDGFVSSFSASIQSSWLQRYAELFFWAYTCVVVFRLLSALIRWNSFCNQYQQSLVKTPIDLRLFTQSKALHFGISKKVTLWCSNAVTTPMTFGFLKPVILLPIALLNQISIQQTEALIIHELTHIRNNDYLLNWLLVIAEALFFFNPFVHIIAQKIKIEREKNCDVQVLQFSYPGILYAETLLKAALQHQKALSMQMAAVKNKKHLLERIHFFSEKNNLEFKNNKPFLTGFGLMIVLCINLALAGIFIHEQKNERNIAAIYPAMNLQTTGNEFPKQISTNAINTKPLLSAMQPVPSKAKRIRTSPTKPTNNSKPEASWITEDDDVNYAMPASNNETLIEGKEIIINEENTEGKKITAAYRALLIDGIWTLQPLWMITETKATKDSLRVMPKDSVIRIIPTIQ